MKIIEMLYDWKNSLSKRAQTDYIVLHHRAGGGDAASIHKSHLALGWAGIGYHLYVRKDGSVFRGRPLDTVGAHCSGYNSKSVGVCFEGNFEYEEMSDLQIAAGLDVVNYLKGVYPSAKIVGHGELQPTACPGANFPLNRMKQNKITTQELVSANDIVWELNNSHFEILDTDKFVRELEEAKNKNNSLYWGYYKLVNRKGVR